MSGNNMESLLLGDDDDDSSSGESESGGAAATTTAVPAASVVAATVVPRHAPPPPPQQQQRQSEMARRLKGMYSPAATHRSTSGNTGNAPPRSTIPHQQPSSSSQQRYQQQQYQQNQRLPSSSSSQQQPSYSHAQPPPPPPPPQYRSSSTTTNSLASLGPPPTGKSRQTTDPFPFEPTPVSQLQARKPSSSTNNPNQMYPGSTMTSTTASGRGNVSTMGTNNSVVSRTSTGSSSSGLSTSDHSRQKELFQKFLKVLIRYLTRKDTQKLAQVKHVIKDCYERNKRREPGFESVTESVRRRIKQIISPHDWKQSELYLKKLLVEEQRQKDKQQQQQGRSGSTASSSSMGGVARPGPTSIPQGGPSSASNTSNPSSLSRMQQAVANKKQALTASGATGSGATTSAAAGTASRKPSSSSTTTTAKSASNRATAGKTASGKGKSVGKKGRRTPETSKTSTSTAASVAATTTAVPSPTKTSTADTTKPTASTKVQLRDYNEFPEMVDHAVVLRSGDAFWSSQKVATQPLTEEQTRLLYQHDEKSTAVITPMETADTANDTSAFPLTEPEKTTSQAESKKTEAEDPFPVPGWGRTNILSARTAWANLRLPERRVLGGNLKGEATSTVSETSSQDPSATTTKFPDSTTSPPFDSSWHNEDVAEDDQVIAALSQGFQEYLRGILTKAVRCARKRQNLDGLRLWHQQVTDSGTEPPALSLRLGCDVGRQVARAAGNDALTCKRMEEALERQHGIPTRDRSLYNDTLEHATSMSEVALRPKLRHGAQAAEYESKKSFEIYGGKHALEPVFGPVPKKVKLVVADLEMGMHCSDFKLRRPFKLV